MSRSLDDIDRVWDWLDGLAWSRQDRPPRVSRGESCCRRGQAQFWITFEVFHPWQTLELTRKTEEGAPDLWSAWILWESRHQSTFESADRHQLRAWIAEQSPKMQRKYPAMVDEALEELAGRDPAGIEPEDPNRPLRLKALFKGEDGKVHLYVKDGEDGEMREDPEGLKDIPAETIEDILMTNDEPIEEPVIAQRDIDGPFRG